MRLPISAPHALTGLLAIGLLAVATGCESYRYAYADARAANTGYHQCLERNPGDPGACESQRRAAGDRIEDYEEHQRCEVDPTLCR